MSSALKIRDSGDKWSRPRSESEAGAVDAATSDWVAEAADRVLAQWSNTSGDALNRSEVEAVLASLVSGVIHAKSGEEVVVPTEARSPLGNHLVNELRHELLRANPELGEDELPDQMNNLIALEKVREAVEPRWSEFFRSRLSGPGSLDLVVQVAHDLRSPLTSILFLAETLQRGQSGEVNDLQKRQLGLIYGAALGLSSVTSDVIEIARGGDQLVDDDLSPFSVREIFESVRDIVRPIAEEKGLEIRLDLPSGDHRLGHPIALSRVLLNLTTNSLKFTDKGHVDLKAEATGMRRVIFSVSDTGPGINPAAMDSLYQPFRRAAGREGYAVSGTGLGLAICRKLVEAMGSELLLDTDPSWGTKFSFEVEIPPANHL